MLTPTPKGPLPAATHGTPNIDISTQDEIELGVLVLKLVVDVGNAIVGAGDLHQVLNRLQL